MSALRITLLSLILDCLARYPKHLHKSVNGSNRKIGTKIWQTFSVC